ncbi:MAG: hypothetical protein COV66_11510 [Nitrospinae bacterium CG11_big_fil_rev_8_21_14_0_20_45_15]|nr:MAG: hypothetical protein COV66_11510 [Nitrospinae bacterium CG11_big_fil_rev_8_21_14_0_20_45_15]
MSTEPEKKINTPLSSRFADWKNALTSKLFSPKNAEENDASSAEKKNESQTSKRSPAILKSLAVELKKRIDDNPENGDYFFQLGGVLMEMQRYGEAASALKSALTLGSKNKSTAFQLARAYVEIGRDDDAVHLLEPELIKHPNSMAVKKLLARAHSNLSVSFGKMQKNEDAVKHFHAATNILPRYAPAHLAMGICLFEMGRYNEAIDKFDECQKMDKNLWVDANFHCGKAYARLGKNKKALNRFKQAISVTCKSALPFLHLGLLYIKMKKYKDAVTPLETAIRLSPKYVPEAYYNLGWVLEKLKRHEDALEPLRSALELTPDDERVLELLAAVLYETAQLRRKEGKHREELAFLREAVRLLPAEPRLRYALGQAFDKIQDGYFAIFNTILAKQLYVQLKDDTQAKNAIKTLAAMFYKYPNDPEEFSKVKAPMISKQ